MIKTIKRGFIVIICLAAVALGWLYHYSNSTVKSLDTPVNINIAAGSSLRSVANQFVANGILDEPWSFILLARGYGKSGQIKAGNYELRGKLTPYNLLTKITGNDYAQESIIFVEGWTFKQIREALNANKSLGHESHNMKDAEILRAIDSDERHPEGWFSPDTYFFTLGSNDLAVLKRAHELMKLRLKNSWGNRAPNLPFSSPYEALIAASIVEKETGHESERPMIAAVIINRLKLGMKLQVDPTVIYGMRGKFDGNLRKQDLLDDQPYNTYTRAGLPPTPIAMPGHAAITATLNPAPSKALYYVSRGDGTSQFSVNLAEHNKAVAKYQKHGTN